MTIITLNPGDTIQNAYPNYPEDPPTGYSSWIDYWSQTTGAAPTACAGVCPLQHPAPNYATAGSTNVCRAVGGHIEHNDDGAMYVFKLLIMIN
jgi:hypothetical protein